MVTQLYWEQFWWGKEEDTAWKKTAVWWWVEGSEKIAEYLSFRKFSNISCLKRQLREQKASERRAEDLNNQLAQYPKMTSHVGKYHNLQPTLEELSIRAAEFRGFQSDWHWRVNHGNPSSSTDARIGPRSLVHHGDQNTLTMWPKILHLAQILYLSINTEIHDEHWGTANREWSHLAGLSFRYWWSAFYLPSQVQKGWVPKPKYFGIIKARRTQIFRKRGKH